MATTQIADLVVPEIYNSYERERIAERSYLWASGLVTNSQALDQRVAGGGDTFNFPFVKPVTQTDSNVGTDTAGTATPQKLTADRQTAVRLERNQGWEMADLASIFSGVDPIVAALDAAGLDLYWSNEMEKASIQILRGVEADNNANDGDDMIYVAGDAGTAAAGAPAATDLISPTAVALAEQTAGDMGTAMSILVCHSAVAANLKVQNLSLTGPGEAQANGAQLSSQRWGYSPYLQKLVVVDDDCPAVADGGSRTLYTSYLCAPGILQFGEAPHVMPLENERLAAAGNGSGFSQLWSRKNFCIHPVGFKWTGTPAGATPTNAELAAAASWDRVFQRKSIPLAFLKTNG